MSRNESGVRPRSLSSWSRWCTALARKAYYLLVELLGYILPLPQFLDTNCSRMRMEQGRLGYLPGRCGLAYNLEVAAVFTKTTKLMWAGQRAGKWTTGLGEAEAYLFDEGQSMFRMNRG